MNEPVLHPFRRLDLLIGLLSLIAAIVLVLLLNTATDAGSTARRLGYLGIGVAVLAVALGVTWRAKKRA